ncbi:hypothetical protein AB4099_19085 [Bosea sp. 2KB_26]|uniref:hypothetical protein n=1 Tax=Bosea sp. 2KB_26 TaxID=3237475 RepID=UPI003F9010DB
MTEEQTSAAPRTKTVYQTNNVGIYLGETVADESPLEPGVWLTPGGCVTVPPPVRSEGELAKWDPNTETWSIVVPPPDPEPEPGPPKKIVLISTFWSRMTDEEAEAVDGAIAGTSVRLRRVFNALGALPNHHPDYSAIRDLVIAAVGSQTRADEILLPEI